MTSPPSSLPRPSTGRALLILLLALGGLLRLLDLTDPPVDFHSTRQLRNALVARAIYYNLLPDADPERQALAASFRRAVGQYEPPIIEGLVAVTYLVTGGEDAAIPRLWQTLFWLLAGLALFDLARRATAPVPALAALAYYLILPFSVQASRSFQPDPLMTSAFIVGLYFLYRWCEEETWQWAILAGAFAGFAALVKIVIAFLVASAAIALVLFSRGRRVWKSLQVWTMAALMTLPALGYYLIGSPGRSTEYFFAWTVALLKLLASTDFYSKWLAFLGSLFGLTLLFFSLFGALTAYPRLRVLLIGLWIGYLLYGLTLPFQMYTHSYYHLQLVPVVALGLAPIAQAIWERVSAQGRVWRAACAGLILSFIGYQAWVARSILLAEDFRHEPAFWETVGAAIPAGSEVIGLTQDYGYRLMYYGWRRVDLWPLASGLAEVRGNQINAEKTFAEMAADKDYFLVTSFNQLDKQPDLKKILDGYPIAAEGEGYVLYDLQPDQ